MDSLIWYGKDAITTFLPAGKEENGYMIDVELKAIDSYFSTQTMQENLQVITFSSMPFTNKDFLTYERSLVLHSELNFLNLTRNK